MKIVILLSLLLEFTTTAINHDDIVFSSCQHIKEYYPLNCSEVYDIRNSKDSSLLLNLNNTPKSHRLLQNSVLTESIFPVCTSFMRLEMKNIVQEMRRIQKVVDDEITNLLLLISIGQVPNMKIFDELRKIYYFASSVEHGAREILKI